MGLLDSVVENITSAGLQRVGYNFQSRVYQDTATQVLQSAKFNRDVLDLNFSRQLTDSTRAFRNALGAQRAGFAAQGVNLRSKSAAAIAAETLRAASTESLRLRQNLALEKSKLEFEAKSQARGLIAEARAADFRGRAAVFSSLLANIDVLGNDVSLPRKQIDLPKDIL